MLYLLNDDEVKESQGKYLIHKNGMGLQVIIANQKKLTKDQFIDALLSSIKNYLNDAILETSEEKDELL